MRVEKNSAKKSATHTVYKNSNDIRVPGTTTITGILNKPALVPWANKLGLQGIEVSKYVDDLAMIGTLAHYMVECFINSKIEGKEIKPNLSDYSENQIDSAENCFLKFLEWDKRNDVVYKATEKRIVSNVHNFGGTVDVLAVVNGVVTLLDIKTCKAIYADHFLQVGGGYLILAEENGLNVQEVRIVRLGRSEDEGVEPEDKLVPNTDKYKELFLRCLDIYNIKKELKWR